MTKKKGIASKLFIGLTGLTLLSCCFLGTTFARYTSGGSGTAEVGVALWDIDFSDADSESTTMSVSVTNLSPSAKPYSSEAEARENQTAVIQLGVINYSTEVNADLTATYSDKFSYTFNDGTKSFDNTGYSWNDDGLQGSGASEKQVRDLFSISLTYGPNASADGAKAFTPGTAVPITAGRGTIYVFVQVTWTSADDDVNVGDTTGSYADAIDTWVGEHLQSISYSFTFNMVQTSTVQS